MSVANATDPATWESFDTMEAGKKLIGQQGKIRFTTTSDEDDQSVVTAYDDDAYDPQQPGNPDETGALKPTLDPEGSPSTDTGDNYLAVNTGTSGLIADVASVSNSTVFIDTLVQFTASDFGPEIDRLQDKIVIWLKSPDDDEDAPTLMATAGHVYDIDLKCKEKTYALSGVDIAENTWYRLTVRSVDSFMGDGTSSLGFQIYIDGTLLTAGEDTVDPLIPAFYSEFLSNEAKSWILNKSVFPALPMENSTYMNGNASHIREIMFRGEGKVDSMVVTESELFSADTYETYLFAIEYAAGVDGNAHATLGEGYDTYEEPKAYQAGEEVLVWVAPNPGYRLVSVDVGTPIVPDGGTIPQVEGNMEDGWILTMPANAVTLPIGFECISVYWVKFANFDNATVTEADGVTPFGSSRQFDVGETVSFKVLPDEGYNLTGVSIETGGVSEELTESEGLYSFTVEGTTVITLAIEADDPQITVTPGAEAVKYAYASAAAASDAARYVRTTAPEEVQSELGQGYDADAYDGMFSVTAVPVEGEDGMYTFLPALTDDVRAEIEEALSVSIQSADIAGAATDEGGSLTVGTKAGLYYGLKSGAELGGLKVTSVKIGTGNSVTFTLVKQEDTGFYQVEVTAEPQAEESPSGN